MTDSRKLTDNELEQVAGGARGTIGGFSIGEYVECWRWQTMTQSGNEIVYRIDTLNGYNATATKYEKDRDTGAVTTTSNQNIDLTLMIKLDSKPTWVPAN